MMEFKKILVTTDFSENSFIAFPYAVDMAQKYDAEITLMHVIEPIIAPADFAWGSYNLTEIEQKTRDYAENNLDKLISEHFPESLTVKKYLAFGTPFKEVIQYARDEKFNLLIISTHGLAGLSYVLFGSTTEKIVRKSPVPVLTVRSENHKFEMP
jgi:nucleotide-binding universal stress UspA family protein